MVKDEFDWKIIEILQKNARLSFAQIGREINLSPSAVAERVQRLEDEQVIKKHACILDSKKVGFSLSAYITLAFKDNGFQLFINSISNFPEIIECSRVTGKDCIIMKVILMDNSHLERVIDGLCKFGSPSTSIVLSDVISNGNIIRPVISNFG